MKLATSFLPSALLCLFILIKLAYSQDDYEDFKETTTTTTTTTTTPKESAEDYEDFTETTTTTTTTTTTSEEPAKANITNNCLRCLCEASTKCRLTAKCERGVCGPFHLSKGYWIDGGKNVREGDDPDSKLAFHKCSVDVECASRTIRSFMTAFAEDCNGDGEVTCDDYAMMHKSGAEACTKDIQSSEYWKNYLKCKNSDATQFRIKMGENM